MSFARQALPVVGALFVACVVIQVFLAGLGLFDDPRSFETHRQFGYLFGMLTLVLLALALAGRQSRRVVGLSALLLLQFALQSLLVALRPSPLAALHPVNGFLILLVAIVVTRAAWQTRAALAGVQVPAGTTTATGEPA
ncbi:MAG TPA: DUF6220 domain-containing protein [Candidatus Limnocylindrales bacterium]|nr:DUF6220 domain-containing protein [Candidatus Limnocylindrales bacterium]